MKNSFVFLLVVLLLASVLTGCGNGKVRDDGALITAAPSIAPTSAPTAVPEISPSTSPVPSDSGSTGGSGVAEDQASASPETT